MFRVTDINTENSVNDTSYLLSTGLLPVPVGGSVVSDLIPENNNINLGSQTNSFNEIYTHNSISTNSISTNILLTQTYPPVTGALGPNIQQQLGDTQDLSSNVLISNLNGSLATNSILLTYPPVTGARGPNVQQQLGDTQDLSSNVLISNLNGSLATNSILLTYSPVTGAPGPNAPRKLGLAQYTPSNLLISNLNGSLSTNSLLLGNSTNSYSVAIGINAGISQGNECVAIGYESGRLTQQDFSIAIGYQSGSINQQNSSIAIGDRSASENQGNSSVAIGTGSGQYNQGYSSIALGLFSGQQNQGNNSIALGYLAGENHQTPNSIAIGTNAGQENRSNASKIYTVGKGKETIFYNYSLDSPDGWIPVYNDFTECNSVYINADSDGNIIKTGVTGKGGLIGATGTIGFITGNYDDYVEYDSQQIIGEGYCISYYKDNDSWIVGGIVGTDTTSNSVIAVKSGDDKFIGIQDSANSLSTCYTLLLSDKLYIGGIPTTSGQSSIYTIMDKTITTDNNTILSTCYKIKLSNGIEDIYACGEGKEYQLSTFDKTSGKWEGIDIYKGTESIFTTIYDFVINKTEIGIMCIFVGKGVTAEGLETGVITYSKNLTDFTSNYDIFTKFANSIIYNSEQNIYEVVGEGTNTNAYSYDGINWTPYIIEGLESGLSIDLNSSINMNESLIAIGNSAGMKYQSYSAIAIGTNAGNASQGEFSVAIGPNAGQNSQGKSAIAIGSSSGQTQQGNFAISLGVFAGNQNQGISAIAIGNASGNQSQGANSIAIGQYTGHQSQGANSIAIGNYAGYYNQSPNSIILNASGSVLDSSATGFYVSPLRQNTDTIAQNILSVGYDTKTFEITYGDINLNYGATGPTGPTGPISISGTNYGDYIYWNTYTSPASWKVGSTNISLGANAGFTGQQLSAIAIGNQAGRINQQMDSISIGNRTGLQNQGTGSISLGYGCGSIEQSKFSIAIGYDSGEQNQQENSIAIGNTAGYNTQGANSIAIGNTAGYNTQGANSIAIGNNAGKFSQGVNSIAIGNNAGVDFQSPNSIILNASSAETLNSLATGFYVSPIRHSTSTSPISDNGSLQYDIATSEIFYNSSKTFVINHPDDTDKYLVHACLEGPESGVYYRGKNEITNNEYVKVELPLYVKNLASNYTIQITPIGNSKKINNYVVDEVKDGDGYFTVYGDSGKFYWLVHGNREAIDVEPSKTDVCVKGSGPYKWI